MPTKAGSDKLGSASKVGFTAQSHPRWSAVKDIL